MPRKPSFAIEPGAQEQIERRQVRIGSHELDSARAVLARDAFGGCEQAAPDATAPLSVAHRDGVDTSAISVERSTCTAGEGRPPRIATKQVSPLT